MFAMTGIVLRRETSLDRKTYQLRDHRRSYLPSRSSIYKVDPMHATAALALDRRA
jgi:hypothetical protein